MDTLAHALWAGAGAKALGRHRAVSARVTAGIVALAVLPDVPHLLPMLTWALESHAPLSFIRDILVATPGTEPSMPVAMHALGRQLYDTMHSAIVAAAVTAVVWMLHGAFPIVLLGWWSQIVIDVFTHSRAYYPVAVLYPLSDRAFDGIAWNTPWFFVVNYLLLIATYVWLLATRRKQQGTRV